MSTYYYCEAPGFVSDPFEAVDVDAAVAYASRTFRDARNPDHTLDDAVIVGWHDGLWQALWEWRTSDLYSVEDGERFEAMLRDVQGETPPTPGGP